MILVEKETHGGDVVIDAGGGVVAHVEPLADPLHCEDADVEGQFSVDVPGSLLQVDGLRLPVYDVALIKLQTGRYAIAEGVDPLVSAACT